LFIFSFPFYFNHNQVFFNVFTRCLFQSNVTDTPNPFGLGVLIHVPEVITVSD
jgi:hypothetical protein